MTASKLPREEFRNPCPHLNILAAKEAVDSLLSNVNQALKEYGEPTQQDRQIVNLAFCDIQHQLIHQSNLTLPRLVEARIRLAIKASLDTHCLTAFPYKEAIREAQHQQRTLIENSDCDDRRKIVNCYPLLGMVFSVKDCIHVQGYPTTLGCSLRASHKEAVTADIVTKLRDAGAIMIAKTTAPQLMMSNTTESPLWGTTRGAVRSAQQDGQDFQVGGSSGGEAALVKLGGSQLGVGTDMGGSVRQPACLNELYGYKFTSTPDSFRWQLPHDFMTGLPHTKVPATAPGLLARDILTLKTAADTLYKHYYSNVRELNEEEHRRDHRDARWETPESEDLGNNPRIVYTTQQSSPEVQKLIRWLITTLEGGDKLLRPRRCKELGDVDVKAWGEAWLDHAKEHGFDDARAMLADDPLIKRTMFDECRLSTWKGVDKKSWKADSSKLKDLKKSFVSQAGLFSENSSSSEDEEENEEDDKDQHADSMRNGSKNNVIIITPTYVLGGPVQNSSFISLDDVGESEIWCQIFNLLDFPALSIPLGKLPCGMREKLREEAVGSPEWCRYLAGKISADLLDKSDQDRLPVLSVQFATVPDNHVAMLDYANRISKMFAYTL